MNSSQAAETLQVIRTLMERAVLYRRALAPAMWFAGGGAVGGMLSAWSLRIQSTGGFVGWWGMVGGLTVLFSMIWMRREALRDREPFWTLPARRVAFSMLPALVAGAGLGVVTWLVHPGLIQWLPGLWMILYGSALHAGGFFLARGIRWLGWLFIVLGLAAVAQAGTGGLSRLYVADEVARCHGVMGAVFGGVHLVYAAYLSLTESRSVL